MSRYEARNEAHGLKRLEQLADFLQHKVNNSWFNLDSWESDGWEQKECGSTACALGWATVRFRGLVMYHGAPQLADDLGLYHPLEVAAYFFDISRDQAYEFFMPCQYEKTHSTKMDVVRKIREYVKERRAKK